MFNYLQQIANKHSPKAEGKKDVIPLLVKNVGKYYPERSHETVHASDVTQPGFCARQFRLLDVTGKKRPDTFLSAALKATFDMGNDVANRITNDWLASDAIGHWKCGTCDKTVKFQSRPGQGCLSMGKCKWEYQEVKFWHPEAQISSSIDAMLPLGGATATIIELKIIKPEDFADLKAPMGEHRLRTRLYLRAIAESDSPYKSLIDTQHAKVLYTSRGYGKMNLEVGQIVPWKEYDVFRDDESVQVFIDKGKEVADARKKGYVPIKKTCDSVGCTTAKECPVRAECWSGQWE